MTVPISGLPEMGQSNCTSRLKPTCVAVHPSRLATLAPQDDSLRTERVKELPPLNAPVRAPATVRLSADVGGTFTDVAAFDETTGELMLG